MNITVVGTGYVGLANAILLSQNNEVIALDVNKEKVEKINNKQSPIADKEIEDFLLDVTDMKKVLLCPPFETSHSLKKQIANRLEKYKCLK